MSNIINIKNLTQKNNRKKWNDELDKIEDCLINITKQRTTIFLTESDFDKRADPQRKENAERDLHIYNLTRMLYEKHLPVRIRARCARMLLTYDPIKNAVICFYFSLNQEQKKEIRVQLKDFLLTPLFQGQVALDHKFEIDRYFQDLIKEKKSKKRG
tara:strand:- start:7978 stop:8448 length:471 start_codon:yes stop_codon:yes gene_type:complete